MAKGTILGTLKRPILRIVNYDSTEQSYEDLLRLRSLGEAFGKVGLPLEEIDQALASFRHPLRRVFPALEREDELRDALAVVKGRSEARSAFERILSIAKNDPDLPETVAEAARAGLEALPKTSHHHYFLDKDLEAALRAATAARRLAIRMATGGKSARTLDVSTRIQRHIYYDIKRRLDAQIGATAKVEQAAYIARLAARYFNERFPSLGPVKPEKLRKMIVNWEALNPPAPDQI